MRKRELHRCATTALALAMIALAACTSVPDCPPAPVAQGQPQLLSKSGVIRIPVVVTPTQSKKVPVGKRIVIADISGKCAAEVKNALMRRLVDNLDYEVLTRDNLQQIIFETEDNWSGKFNTQTAVKLGELLGASLFIVGDVIYCGPAEEWSGGKVKNGQYDLLAVLHILDLQTGKVLLSSSDHGTHVNGAVPMVVAEDPLADSDRTIGNSEDVKAIKVNLPALKAAEDLANSFADKFFARPTWEELEMWENDRWEYGRAFRSVKLGDCARAVKDIAADGAEELHAMHEVYVAEYLHNFGVALLCDNRVDEAMDKLRSSYRITYHDTTLRMLDIAARIDEWSLKIQVDQEPEVDMLLGRGPYLRR